MNVLSTPAAPVAIDCVIIDWDQVQLPATAPEPQPANEPARL
ncbi:hypothetical protein [Leifsonia sp. P73]